MMTRSQAGFGLPLCALTICETPSPPLAPHALKAEEAACMHALAPVRRAGAVQDP